MSDNAGLMKYMTDLTYFATRFECKYIACLPGTKISVNRDIEECGLEHHYPLEVLK
jgi:hypothetical protein